MIGPRRISWGLLIGFLTGFSLCAPSFVGFGDADAAQRARAARPAPRPAAKPQRPPTPSPERDAAMIVDGVTGHVLYARNADALRYPASLTKMMTLYLTFEALNNKKIGIDTELTTSTHAAAQFPTKLGLKPGDTIPLDTAMKAVAVLSANDVAVVLAEALGGSESNFASLMTKKAHELGMMHTNFDNASGLPDKDQWTSAADMALLGRHLAYDFPQYFHYFSTPSFMWGKRVYLSHDFLLDSFPGTDGIKTGYTRASGFNLVSSVVRGNKHIIGVVMGGVSVQGRDREMIQLLSAAFTLSDSDRTVLADANAPWLGGKGPAVWPFKTAQVRQAQAKPVPPKETPVAEAKIPDAQPSAVNDIPVPPDGSGTTPLVPPPDAAPPMPQPDTPPIAAAEPDPTVVTAAPVLSAADVATPGPGVTVNLLPELTPPKRGAQPKGTDRVAALIPPPPVTTLDASQGDLVDPPTTSDGTKRWAIQIGAFGSASLAEAQLASYARLAVDVLAQAKRFIVPFETEDGKKLYRARFGLFAEDEAREICKRMERLQQVCLTAQQVN